MENGLPSILSNIRHHSKARRVRFTRLRINLYGLKNIKQLIFIMLYQIIHVPRMFLMDKQNVFLREWIKVFKSIDSFIFINFFTGNFTGNNFAK